MSVRQDIATAATLAGVTNVTPYFRQSTTMGDGCVRLDRLTRSQNGYGYMATWQVVLFLAQDLATAELWIDTHLDDLIAALEAQLIVTAVTPSQIPLDTGTVPALVIEGARAHE